MSLTETAKHWLWGCALATAASKSDVNVAMPHLRGKWSPTNAILRTLEVLFMKTFLYFPGSALPSINLSLPVARQVGNEVDPSGFVAPGNNRLGKAAFLSTSAPSGTRFPPRSRRHSRTHHLGIVQALVLWRRAV